MTTTATWRDHLHHWLRPVLGLCLFVAALVALDLQLKQHSLGEVLAQTRAIPAVHLLLALLCTGGSYLAMTGYDLVALRHLGNRLRYGRIALTSFIAYVFSMDLGMSVIGSSAVRYRLYSGFGVEAGDVARVIALTALAFWVGVLSVGGVVLTQAALPLPDTLSLPFATTRPVGWVLLAAMAVLLLLNVTRHKPLHWRGFELPLLRLWGLVSQALVAAVDWSLAAAVLYFLLPASAEVSYWQVLAVFLAAQTLGVLSTVPAGLGVFESICAALLAPYYSAPAVLGALLAYRFIYTLLPVFAALTLFGGFEALQRRQAIGETSRTLRTVLSRLAPQVFSVGTFLAGLLLMISSVLPPLATKLHLTDIRLLVDISATVAMLSGLALVLVSRGLAARTRGSFRASLALLASGFISATLLSAHLFVGLMLALLMLALWLGRAEFNRPSALRLPPLPRYWAVVLLVTLLGIAWSIGWIEHSGRHAADLFGQFSAGEYGARARTALYAATIALSFYILWRLSRPALPATEAVDADTMARVSAIVAASPDPEAKLALLGDKQFLLNEAGTAFIMYGVAGNSLIAMGDPVGPVEEHEGLIWQFRELCDRHGAWPVFYEVTAHNLPVYLDLGLSLNKLGESAQVPLADFNLEGKKRAKMRQAINRGERDGCRFEVIPAPQTDAMLDTVQAISEQWLAGKNTAEKGFSLGAFKRDYLRDMPVAVIRVEDKVVAFANLWCGGEHDGLSVDLMRYSDDAPNGVMELLFIHTILWGQDAGYRCFGLGMAPLSGLPDHHLASTWVRAGAFIYRHGEHFYNFDGLRAYKQKFAPDWEPRYLASPGGLALPRVLAQASALVSGGLRRLVG
ncbi:bifunctional lysylphosphatidylglycerol flippase/synthetase MprF [Halioglobus sp.]|nr:bifunctional lysylphosphatidylglycerol flippase/synthetase MprF [Halioglobus sp.]